MQALDLKAKAANAEMDRKEEAERRKRIDEKLEKALDMLISERGSRKRKRRDHAEDAESDKENVDPDDE